MQLATSSLQQACPHNPALVGCWSTASVASLGKPCVTQFRAQKKEPDWVPNIAWQRPILAGGDPPTTIGVLKLNFRVRHGNGCILQAIATTLLRAYSLKTRYYQLSPENTNHLVKSSTD